jgi:Holliday junction resolvasome RuvABC endonuclease subunit
MNPELVLGFDIQPKRLGWAYYDALYRKSGCITFSNLKFEEPFLWQQVDRAVLIVLEEVDKINGKILGFYIEQPFLLSVKIAYNYGYIMAFLRVALEKYEPDIGIEWFQPKEWRKLSIENGNASKEEIFQTAVSLGFQPENQDAADASLIAIAGRTTYDSFEARLPKNGSKELL